MAISISYEVYAHKVGNWNIDSVYDDKAEALYEAKQLLESRHSTGVKVNEERFNDDTGDGSSKVIFQETKGTGNKAKPKPKPKPKGHKGVKTSKPDVKPRRRPRRIGKDKPDSFVRYVIMLVVAVGGTGLGLLALLFFLMGQFE